MLVNNLNNLRAIFLPGLVFQSVVVAGGYGTGRELVAFFLNTGPTTGLIGLLTTCVIWSFVCKLTFEYAQSTASYDYRQFFSHLLGPMWPAFELTYLGITVTVLAVIAASTGTIAVTRFGQPYIVGVGFLFIYVGFMVFRGTRAIENVLSIWSFFLYLTFICLVAMAYQTTELNAYLILRHDTQLDILTGLYQGIRYAGYNLGLIPAVLFTVKHCQSQRQAKAAGLLAGPIAVLPGLMFYCTMLLYYPAIIEADIPADYLLTQIGANWLHTAYTIVLFGTLIETSTGLIHSLNERIANQCQQLEVAFSTWARPLVAAGAFILTGLLAHVGLDDLITKGYGALTWFVIIVYILPLIATRIFTVKNNRI